MKEAAVRPEDYHELLCEYADHLRRKGPIEVAALALRMPSVALFDVISYIATQGKKTFEELRKHMSGETPDIEGFRYDWLAALGRVLVLQADPQPLKPASAEIIHFGTKCLTSANQKLSKNETNKHYHQLEIELSGWQNRTDVALHLLNANQLLQGYYYSFYNTELHNPALTQSNSGYETWKQGFNRPFVENHLAPISCTTFEQGSFDSLATDSPQIEQNGPLISVILTCYKPERNKLNLAVQSILTQSWENLELIIVDDASPPEFEPVLLAVEALDPRIQIIRLASNRGTYRARNVGFAAASGDYVTGQDSDDWSHPQRLTQQVHELESNLDIAGVVVEAIRLNDNLVRMFPGRIPNRMCEVSLMIRRRLAEDVGGYIEARKGSDSEFRRRIESFTGQPIYNIRKPLYLIRIGEKSLSHGDFRPGWSHPARRAYWNSSQHWHENSLKNELTLTQETRETQLPIPNRFKMVPDKSFRHFNAIFLGDWRSYAGKQRQMVDEIKALKSADQNVGIMQLESLLSQSTEAVRLSTQVQDLINSNYVHEVLPDEKATTNFLLVHDPTILQFLPTKGIDLTADIILITPSMPPLDQEIAGGLYSPALCDWNARAVFNGKTYWNSSDPLVKRALQNHDPSLELHLDHKPVTLDITSWVSIRQKLSNERPVIGRHAEDYAAVWPNNYDLIESLWPSDESADVRILGDARAFLRRFNKEAYPDEWLVFKDRDIDPEAWVQAIDFFVYYPDDSLKQGFSREALEAVAAGAIAILPERFKEAHGKSAIYAPPNSVSKIIRDLSSELSEYLEIVRRSQEEFKSMQNSYPLVAYLRALQRHAFSGNQEILEKNETR